MLQYIHDAIFEGDAREKALIKYPTIYISIVVAYVLFIKWIGPAIMKNRKPFDLKYVMVAYDLAQVLVNGYLTYTIYRFVAETWELRCMVKNSEHLPFYLKRILRVGWLVCLVKFADLIDTVFFVLRKKDSQVSFLHVFHHVFMCVLMCWGVKNLDSYTLGFYSGFALSINTSVHMVVYFYYGIAALGPQMDKYLWWKQYLTIFQMAQFTAILGYMTHGFITGCEEMGPMEISVFIYIIVIFILFIDFYRKYKVE